MNRKSHTSITPRQLEMLRAVRNFEKNRCYSATIAELAGHLSVSRSTAFEHIGQLRQKGLIKNLPGRARSLKLTAKAARLLKEAKRTQTPRQDYCCPSSAEESIPLAGRVAAGLPADAVEEIASLTLSSLFGRNGDVFALEVRGESMIEEGIHNGDYVICRKQPNAEQGALVVAIVDDNYATLKRCTREKNRARLDPANKNYRPIYSEKCRIEAVVIGLIRKL